MSLSQKHVGKVFVPWFNNAEWKQVYNVLFLQLDKNYREALTILKIWKHRTPLLSAGVEGTLILLEALLTEKEQLTEHQLIQIYAISIMRFLNLCAANSEKQGTFYKTAVKNELPKWLINIRHDIAHDHKLPSLSVLELGLHQCLEWIKNKYWEIQKEINTDYIVTEESNNIKIMEVLKIYVKLNLNLLSKNVDDSDYDENVIEKINNIIFEKTNQPTTDISDIITFLEEYLSDSLSKLLNNVDKKQLSNLLVYEALLSTETETTSDGNRCIPRDFRNTWSYLLNILNERYFISLVLDELIDATNNIELNNTTRKTAAIWISELLTGLQKIQLLKEEFVNPETENSDQRSKSNILKVKSDLEQKYPEYEGSLDFFSTNISDCANIQILQEKVLHNPDDYTLDFLEKLLRFNRHSENYILDTINLVKKFLLPNEPIKEEEIFTIDHLVVYNVNDHCNMDKTDSEETIIVDTNDYDAGIKSTRWQPIKDTTPYRRCPLGVLPHQNRHKNPLLTF